jgi:hypothetical protein
MSGLIPCANPAGSTQACGVFAFVCLRAAERALGPPMARRAHFPETVRCALCFFHQLPRPGYQVARLHDQGADLLARRRAFTDQSSPAPERRRGYQ